MGVGYLIVWFYAFAVDGGISNAFNKRPLWTLANVACGSRPCENAKVLGFRVSLYPSRVAAKPIGCDLKGGFFGTWHSACVFTQPRSALAAYPCAQLDIRMSARLTWWTFGFQSCLSRAGQTSTDSIVQENPVPAVNLDSCACRHGVCTVGAQVTSVKK